MNRLGYASVAGPASNDHPSTLLNVALTGPNGGWIGATPLSAPAAEGLAADIADATGGCYVTERELAHLRSAFAAWRTLDRDKRATPGQCLSAASRALYLAENTCGIYTLKTGG